MSSGRNDNSECLISGDRWHSLVELAPDGISTIDMKGVITSINASFCRLSGFSRDEIVGKHFTKLRTIREKDIPKFIKLFESVVKGEMTRPVEFVFNHKDGATRWGEAIIRLIDLGDGKREILVIERDITERKRIESELKRSEERWRTLVELAPDGILTMDLKGVVTSVNNSFLERSGYARNEIVGKHFSKLKTIQVKDLPKYIQMFASLLRGKIPPPFEYMYVHKDGTTKWAEGHFSIFNIGRKKQLLAILREITKRKEAEESRYQLLVDYEQRIKELNCLYELSKLIETQGMSPPLLFQETVKLLASSLRYDKVACVRIIFGDKVFQTKNFKESPWMLSADINLDGNRIGVLEVFYLEEIPKGDEEPFLKEERVLIYTVAERLGRIIERKQMEESLIESEEKFRVLFEQAADSIVLVDAVTYSIVDFNKIAHKNLGYTREEFSKLRVQDLELLEPQEELKNQIIRAQGLGEVSLETKLRGKNGEVHDFFMKIRKISFGGNNYLLCVWEDITERRRIEKRLIESERRWRTLFEMAPDGIITLTQKGTVTSINNAFSELTGFSRDEIVGKHFTKLGTLNLKDLPTYLKIFSSILRGKVTPSMNFSYKRKDGLIGCAESHISLVEFEKGRREVLAIVRDITAQIEAEENLVEYADHLEEMVDEKTRELIDAERLMAAGRVASTLGQELKNPLKTVTNAVSYARKFPEKADEMLYTIDGAVKQATDVLEELLQQTKDTPPQVKTVNLEEMILEMVETFPKPDNIKVDLQLGKNLGAIPLDPHKMRRVLENLLMNAIEAMTDGGRLGVSAGKEHEEIVIEVSDTGKGISKEEMETIFKPFYSSKTDGLGLGLAYCKRVVEEHNGTITAYSKPGKGTTFTIIIPDVKINDPT